MQDAVVFLPPPRPAAVTDAFETGRGAWGVEAVVGVRGAARVMEEGQAVGEGASTQFGDVRRVVVKCLVRR